MVGTTGAAEVAAEQRRRQRLNGGMARATPAQTPRRQQQPQQPQPQQRRGRALKGGGSDDGTGERIWRNPTFGSFDDFGSAMLLLLVMSSGDDWDSAMYWAMDSAEEGMPRVRNDSSAVSLFFVLWM